MSTIEINLPDMPSAEDLARRLGTDEWLLGLTEGNDRKCLGWSASLIKGRLLISEWRWTDEDPEWRQVVVLNLPPNSVADLQRFMTTTAGEKPAMFERET